VVRALAQRGGGDRRPGPQRAGRARADARSPRLRRAAVRPPRRGRERRRLQCLRLGRRRRHQGGRDLPRPAPGRRRGGSAVSACPLAAS
jgi:hypothetical protein